MLLGLGLQEPTDIAPLALSGRIPVKVCLEGGAIRNGDFLTSSSTPGVAMKATEPGRVIGMALGSFDDPSEAESETGKVVTLINPHWRGAR